MKVADAAGSQAGDGDSTSASKLGKRLVSSGGGGNIPGMSPIPIPFMITLMLQIFSIIFFLLTVVILLNVRFIRR
jgi:hypothetical protein